MADDTLRHDAPSLPEERALLDSLKVGDCRKAILMAGLPEVMEWTCTKAESKRWAFDGKFCGQRVLSIVIRETSSGLALDVED